jgi:small subunit ribosomal protein S6
MTGRYETVYIFDSALEEPAITEKLNKFHALLTKDGSGSIASVNHWGKRQLSYKVRKKDTGYYVVAKFEADRGALPEYERLVKLDEGVLRYLVVQAGEEPRQAAVAPVASVEEEKEEEE